MYNKQSRGFGALFSSQKGRPGAVSPLETLEASVF